LSRRLSAPHLIVLAFAALMGLGTLLLKLPASTYGGISWVDAFFVSVSAASVTGLSSVDYPATFTHLGSIVVMVLIQGGSLGIMTITTLAALLVGRRVGFRDLLVLVATLALMVSDALLLLPAMFKATSAFGTVGLSLNVTPELSTFGKLLVAGVMCS
jgi:Trk-type K+ transport system membrane component